MNPDKKIPEKGFWYTVEEDLLRRYGAWPVELKLRWLAEATAFIDKVAPERTKRLHRLFREGKI